MKVIDNKTDARLLELDNGEKIKLLAEGDLTIVVVSVTNKVKIGAFDFNFIDDDNGGAYKLTHMFLDEVPGYTGQGIGKECLRFCHDYTGSTIVCGKSNGEEADDGSHLTGGGQGFAEHMIEKGIISGQM